MKNQTLSAIVSSMLTKVQNETLNLGSIKKLTLELKGVDIKFLELGKTRFEKSTELAKELFKSKEQFNEFCKAVQNLAIDNELAKPTKKEIVPLVYGFKPAMYFRYLQVGEIPENVVLKFVEKCDEAEAEGLKSLRTLEGLVSWFKKFDEHKGEAETDIESINDAKEGTPKRTAIWSISEGAKKCVVFNDGTFKSDFSNEEINTFLNDTLIIKIRQMFATPKPLTKMQKEVLNKVAKNKAVKLTKDLVLTTA